jgi:hypothetical protein
MMSNHRYAKSIADASWYQIQMLTTYKAAWAGKIVEFVEAKNTTKECSRCHKINDMPIWKRTMECSCGNTEDRDIDASFVIRDRSIEYQKLKNNMLNGNTLNRNILEMNKSISTTATVGRACLSSPEEKDTMIQEALSNKKSEECTEQSSIQAPPFRAG